jgi:putative aldouronate transport system substrate-binding protein
MADFNAKANMSKALGFTFDNSALTTEYTALTNIYNQYQKQLEYGFVDPVIGIKEMVDKMQSAGLQKYIDAKKTALEAWAAK